MIPMGDLTLQTSAIRETLDIRFDKMLEQSSFIGGHDIVEFERQFRDYVGTNECIGVGNGTDALEIILRGLNVRSGDEVIVPAFSYAATSEAVLNVGAKPIFVDVGNDLLIDLNEVSEAISNRTRAVIPVHLYGNPVNTYDLNEMAQDWGIHIVEDAAQGHGAALGQVRVGSLGKAAAFSFYPGKNLGAWGDAGAITTDDPELARSFRRIANHGRLAKFDHEILGRNSRLDTLQAIVLSEKLRFLDAWIARRRENAQVYLTEFSEIDWLQIPMATGKSSHAWHLFVLLVPDRDQFRNYMKNLGIETGVHYPYALPDLPFHRDGTQKGNFSNARKAATCVVSIPVGEHLTRQDIDQIVNAVKEYQPDF